MAWWFVQIVKAKDMSDIRNACAAPHVGVLVSSRNKSKLLTIKLKEIKRWRFSCSFKGRSKY
jgi:hypothetical protein